MNLKKNNLDKQAYQHKRDKQDEQVKQDKQSKLDKQDTQNKWDKQSIQDKQDDQEKQDKKDKQDKQEKQDKDRHGHMNIWTETRINLNLNPIKVDPELDPAQPHLFGFHMEININMNNL